MAVDLSEFFDDEAPAGTTATREPLAGSSGLDEFFDSPEDVAPRESVSVSLDEFFDPPEQEAEERPLPAREFLEQVRGQREPLPEPEPDPSFVGQLGRGALSGGARILGGVAKAEAATGMLTPSSNPVEMIRKVIRPITGERDPVFSPEGVRKAVAGLLGQEDPLELAADTMLDFAQRISPQGEMHGKILNILPLGEKATREDWKKLGVTLVEQLPQYIAAAALAVRGAPQAAGPLIGMSAGGAKLHELEKTAPELSRAARYVNAATTGTIEAITNQLGTMKVIQNALKSKAAKATFKEVIKESLKGAGIGGTEEALAQFGENIVDSVSGILEPKNLLRGVGESFFVGAIMDSATAFLGTQNVEGDQSAIDDVQNFTGTVAQQEQVEPLISLDADAIADQTLAQEGEIDTGELPSVIAPEAAAVESVQPEAEAAPKTGLDAPLVGGSESAETTGRRFDEHTRGRSVGEGRGTGLDALGVGATDRAAGGVGEATARRTAGGDAGPIEGLRQLGSKGVREGAVGREVDSGSSGNSLSDQATAAEQRDAAYLDAVERGDVAAQQQAVDEAASDAGLDPTPLLHGTSKDFNQFQERKTAKRDEMFSFGFHFTDDAGLAGRFGNRIVSAYLSTKNTLDSEQVVYRDTELGQWLSRVAPKTQWFPESGREVVYLRNALDALPGRRAKKILQDAGYDSMRYRAKFSELGIGGQRVLDEGDTVIVFDPSQIKSSAPITRDDQGNIIPPSRRFAEGTADIRGVTAEQVAETAQERATENGTTKRAELNRAADELSEDLGQDGVIPKTGGNNAVAERIANELKQPDRDDGGTGIRFDNDAGNPAAFETGPERPRQFLTKTQEIPGTPEDVLERLKEVEPQVYEQHRTTQAYEVIRDWVNESDANAQEARRRVFSDEPSSASKSILAIALMERARAQQDAETESEINDHYDRQLREAGRFVQAASLWYKMSGRGFVNSYKKLAKRLGYSPTTQELQDITQMFDEASRLTGEEKTQAINEAVHFAASTLPLRFRDWLDAFRYTNMLSSPRTHLRNTVFNAFNMLIGRPAALIGRAQPIEAIRFVGAALRQMPQAFEEARAAMSRDSADFAKEVESLGARARTSAIEASRLKQRLPRSLQIIPDFLNAQDRFFSFMISSAETQRLVRKGFAEDQAVEMGRTLGQKYLLRQRIGEDMDNKDIAAVNRVIDDLGLLIEKGRNLPVIGKPMGWFVPFVTTPLNWAKVGNEATPLGLMPKPKQRQNESDQAYAVRLEEHATRQGMARFGSFVTMIGAFLAMAGQTTWAPPPDEKEREAFYASGRKPFSVLINGKWVPFWYFGPFAFSLAIPAAFRDAWRDNPNHRSKPWLDRMGAVAMGMTRFISEQTPLRGFNVFLRLLSGEESYSLGKGLAFNAGQFIPGSGFVRYINGIIDPSFRKTKNFQEQMRKDIPFLSQSLEAHTLPDGTVATRTVSDYVMPFTVGTVEDRWESVFQDRRNLLTSRADNNRILDAVIRDFKRGQVPWSEVLMVIGSQPLDEQGRLRQRIRQKFPEFRDRIATIRRGGSRRRGRSRSR